MLGKQEKINKNNNDKYPMKYEHYLAMLCRQEWVKYLAISDAKPKTHSNIAHISYWCQVQLAIQVRGTLVFILHDWSRRMDPNSQVKPSFFIG